MSAAGLNQGWLARRRTKCRPTRPVAPSTATGRRVSVDMVLLQPLLGKTITNWQMPAAADQSKHHASSVRPVPPPAAEPPAPGHIPSCSVRLTRYHYVPGQRWRELDAA